jgi:hypothetical protein
VRAYEASREDADDRQVRWSHVSNLKVAHERITHRSF